MTNDARQSRGLALVQAKGRRIKHIAGAKYLVPSAQDGAAGYVVDVEAASCTCPDHETRQISCKHLWALRYFRAEVTTPDGTTVVSESIRVTYSQNWPAYNKAQCEEKHRVQVLLRGLCDGICEPRQERGRPRVPLRDAVYSATLKVYTTMSGRRATTDIRASVEDAPHYNSIFRTIERADHMPLFRMLVDESAKPLRAIEKSFAVDSTGFASQSYIRWYDYRYGEERRAQRWVKLHAACGTLTDIITTAEATEATEGDCPMLPSLVERTAANGFTIENVSADKAYLSHKNLEAIEAVGARPWIPFKSNSGSTGSAAWERLFHFYSFNKDEFLKKYHARSRIEGTFSALKRKFGGSLRSKLPAAQLNEVLLKCLCHNLSALVHSTLELGIDAKFWLPEQAS